MSDLPGIELPVWNRYYTPVRLSRDVVHVQAGPIAGATVTIREPGVDRSVIELIDGETTAAEIVASYPDEERAISILRELERNKIVLEAAGDRVDFAATPISPIRMRRSEDDGVGNRGRVFVLQRGAVGNGFYRYLRDAGIDEVYASGPENDVCVPDFVTEIDLENADYASYDYAAYLGNGGFDRHARAFNAELVRAGVPGIFGVRDGFDVFVGPTVFPGETGCLRCFLERLATNSSQTNRFKAHLHAESVANEGAHADLRFDIATNFVAIELANLVRHDQNVTSGRFVHLNSMNLALSADEVLKLPDCDVCATGRSSSTRVRITDRIVGNEGTR